MNGTPFRDSDATRNSTPETESGVDPKVEEVECIISGVVVIDIDKASRGQVTHDQPEHRGESLQPPTCDLAVSRGRGVGQEEWPFEVSRLSHLGMTKATSSRNAGGLGWIQ